MSCVHCVGIFIIALSRGLQSQNYSSFHKSDIFHLIGVINLSHLKLFHSVKEKLIDQYTVKTGTYYSMTIIYDMTERFFLSFFLCWKIILNMCCNFFELVVCFYSIYIKIVHKILLNETLQLLLVIPAGSDHTCHVDDHDAKSED